MLTIIGRHYPPVDRACNPAGVPLRCLIVDDNASFPEAAATLLERMG
jgi:hypothetical protein